MKDYQLVEILLAEDNETDAELCLRALRKCKVANHIHWVKDGAEALEFLFGVGAYSERDPVRCPKLLLLDLKMPRVDGLDVLRRIKAEQHLHNMPVVMMTSSNEESDVVRSYDLGVNSYIVKPMDFAQFSATVAKVGFYWIVANRAAGVGTSSAAGKAAA